MQTPSPLYSGERAGVRGFSRSDPGAFAPFRFPQEAPHPSSPLSTGERGRNRQRPSETEISDRQQTFRNFLIIHFQSPSSPRRQAPQQEKKNHVGMRPVRSDSFF